MEIIDTKAKLISAFGSASNAAKYLGVSKQYVGMWPEKFPQKLTCWATGANLIRICRAAKKNKAAGNIKYQSVWKWGDNQQGNPNGTESEAVME